MKGSKIIPINKKELRKNAPASEEYDFQGKAQKFEEYFRDPEQQHKIFTELGFSWHDDEDICFACERNGSCPEHPGTKNLYVNGRLNLDSTPSLKKIQIVVDEIFIADAMENHDPISESTSYLDVETGEVVTITTEVGDIIELDDTSAIETLPDWQKDEVEIANKVLGDESGRYVTIPRLESHESFRFMEEFVDQLKNDRVAECLAQALRKSRPFRRFKDVLSEWPEIEQQWYAFKNKKVRKEITEFLSSIERERIELTLPTRA